MGQIKEKLMSLKPEESYRIKTGLCRLKSAFSLNEFDYGCVKTFEHRIELNDPNPVKQICRRFPMHIKDKIQEHIKKLLEADIIEPNQSPWASNFVLTKKKDGSFRICSVFRPLNDRTIKNTSPLPRIDDTLDSLREAKYYNSLDLFAGFHQVPVRECDRIKTAFITPHGVFQFKKMPWGLYNAPSTFQEMMNNIMREYIGKFCMVYVDDDIVYSKSLGEHLTL
ncbi:Transposon Ty3-I Gag-Pol polyprotein [Thelohanellus kitauei]|uniref:Transposon Ty3-I Gag-Pol polyprotein n=1 Tax=Thelohanellus kitauei TaxID=669202 RepID=A0A0C2NC31_THEKT|nr:Transposon Ty3-I Gag-Pol polyprotein [Thelohanellus kitauei]